MKLKAYGWTTFYSNPEDGGKYWTFGINLLPHIDLDINRHDFLPDEDCPIRRNGVNIYLLFSWLAFGFTLDCRFGRDTGYWPGNDKE